MLEEISYPDGRKFDKKPQITYTYKSTKERKEIFSHFYKRQTWQVVNERTENVAIVETLL